MKMHFRFSFTAILLSLFLFVSPSARAQDEAGRRIAPAVATILVHDGSTAGRFEAVGSGVFVRSDGVLLTAYTLVQGAREIQVRLANGETYDKPELIASDERRNIAVLRIHATNTPCVVAGATGESAIGASVQAVYSAGGQVVAQSGGILSSISLSDEIPGAGTGFRVLKFTTPVAAEAMGGVLIDNYGRALGLIAPLPQSRAQSYAVPLYNVVGLVRSAASSPTATSIVLAPDMRPLNRAIPVYQPSTTPLEPMPQVSVPQRPTLPLAPVGPGSSVVKETDPAKLLLASKTLYVTSRSNLFKPIQLLNELRKRNEFAEWNLAFVDDYGVADLVLTIEHVPLTWEFSFSVRHQRTGIIITTGKTYAWGGGDGAFTMAGRVVERFTKLRAAAAKSENKTETSAPAKQ